MQLVNPDNNNSTGAEIEIKHGSRRYRLLFSDIRYISANQGGCEYFIGNQMPLWDNFKLKARQESLPNDIFIRCHKSYIVNKTHITWIDRNMLSLKDGTELPIGRVYRKNVF